MERIKLIWDFRSVDGLKISEHHVKHLNEYIEKEAIPNTSSGSEKISENHYIAFLETDKSMMIKLRDALKPHRGEKLI